MKQINILTIALGLCLVNVIGCSSDKQSDTRSQLERDDLRGRSIERFNEEQQDTLNKSRIEEEEGNRLPEVCEPEENERSEENSEAGGYSQSDDYSQSQENSESEGYSQSEGGYGSEENSQSGGYSE